MSSLRCLWTSFTHLKTEISVQTEQFRRAVLVCIWQKVIQNHISSLVVASFLWKKKNKTHTTFGLREEHLPNCESYCLFKSCWPSRRVTWSEFRFFTSQMPGKLLQSVFLAGNNRSWLISVVIIKAGFTDVVVPEAGFIGVMIRAHGHTRVVYLLYNFLSHWLSVLVSAIITALPTSCDSGILQ